MVDISRYEGCKPILRLNRLATFPGCRGFATKPSLRLARSRVLGQHGRAHIYAHLPPGFEIPGIHGGAAADLAGGPAGTPSWRNLLFTAPFLAVYTWLLIYPLMAGIRLSLYRANLFGRAHFIGVDNYVPLFRDATFLQALGNSCLFVALCVPVLVVLALTLARALNRAPPFAGFLRGAVLGASVLSVTVLTIVWREVVSPDGSLLGKATQAARILPPAFLSDRHRVSPSLA